MMWVLLFYPYAISLRASDLEQGRVYTATISAPAGAAVEIRAPGWLSVGDVSYIGGDTFKAQVTVRGDNQIGRVELWVDGVLRASQGVRVGNPERRIYLPWIAKTPAP